MKYCVYCGSFNPINNIDLNMAKFVLNNFSYAHIIFVPYYKLPQKMVNEKQALHRYDMVKLAIDGEKNFSISNIQYRGEKYAYPYNVICELSKMFSNVDGKMGFIISSSEFENIRTWYQSEKLKQIVDFLIYPNEEDFNPKKNRYIYLKDQGYNFKVIDMSSEELSYTSVQSNIKNGVVVENLIPDVVREYMKKNNL